MGQFRPCWRGETSRGSYFYAICLESFVDHVAASTTTQASLDTRFGPARGLRPQVGKVSSRLGTMVSSTCAFFCVEHVMRTSNFVVAAVLVFFFLEGVVKQRR